MHASEDEAYIPLMVGRDYLFVARAQEAQYIRHISSELIKDRLDRMIPMAEDWHAKVCLLEVSISS